MSKNLTEKRISYGQYRLADILVFMLIMCVCEVVNIFALQKWFQGMMFTISVMLLVTLIMIIRWNWFGLLFPIADGLLYCWMNGAAGWQFAVYALGNAFAALAGLIFLVVPKEKITSLWIFTVLYAVAGFVFMILGRSLTATLFGQDFGKIFVATLAAEALNLAFAIAGLLILRKINDMLVDQKQYLIRVTGERDEIKHAEEYRWDGYTELNEDDLQALAAMDEYDRALNFNSRSLSRIKKNDGHEIGELGGETQEAGDEQSDELKELSELDGK